MGTEVNTSYIYLPKNQKKKLGIKHPIITFVIKNVYQPPLCLIPKQLKKYVSLMIEILDDKGIKRKFIANNFQTTTRVKPFVCSMPMTMEDGWNQININLLDFTRKAYGTNYVETLRVQIHANCRIRRIYFSDKQYEEKDLPKEFRLFVPVNIHPINFIPIESREFLECGLIPESLVKLNFILNLYQTKI